MTSLPTDRIFDLRNEIHKNVSKVYANKAQCKRLCERIDQLIDPLECLEHATSSILREETRPILDKLLQCIDDYLCLGLNIQELFDRKHDQEDRQKDLKDLNNKLDEISQKMLEKQCEQYKLIDKMIDKRFQSFRFFWWGFADVYKAQWLTHHDQVAMKIIRINHLSNIEKDFYQEVSTIYRMRYENILNVFGACVEPNLYAIIVEYMPLGSLYDILHKKSEQISFDWFDRYSVAWQMSKSINYLHNLYPAIIHRDIKSMNFLLKQNGFSNQKYLVKVSPELFIPYSRHSKQTDIYSLGIVFWELATARKPWDEYEDEKIIIAQIKTGERPTIPSDIPESYKQIIQEAWNHDPQKRPTCFQLMERIYKEMNQTNQSIITNNEKDIIGLHRQQTVTEQNNDYVNSTTNTDSTIIAIQVDEEEKEEKKLKNSLQTIIISEPLQDETKIQEKTNMEQTETTQIESETMLRQSSSSNITEEPNQTISSPIAQIESESMPQQNSSSNITEEPNQTISSPIAQIESESMPQQNPSSNITEEPNETISSPIAQIEPESMPQQNVSSNIIEEQNQIISSPMAQSKLESMVQQNLSSNIIEEQNQTNSCPIPQINLTSNTQAGNNTEYLCNLTSIPIYRLEKRRPLHPQPRWTQKKT
ncbi:unnamed protein product [Rotaria sordida]|uniref:Protein kinase domain-containing protein n=1 Tax=Rotaria sordida TaxID=392033 RepID=A0A815C3H0_9BILA|nr:unnamed protein product [Rotaria sordida]